MIDRSIPKSKNPVNTSSESGEESSLVTTIISQQKAPWIPFTNFKLELFPCSVRVLRPGSHVIPKPGKKGVITSFTWASKRRLRFTAANAQPALISQFGLTYHTHAPSSGKEVKADLNRWLVRLRRAYPEMGYLWILEFHPKKGSHHEGWPHIHIWLTETVGYGLHQFMAGSWNEIVEPESDEHLNHHLHPENFITWEMRSAGYLTKYLDKESQKRVPHGFVDVGRFWGASRGLVKDPLLVGDRKIDDTFSHVPWKPSKYILRTICKSQERKLKKRNKWKNYGRRSNRNYTILEGRAIFERLIEYHDKLSPF